MGSALSSPLIPALAAGSLVYLTAAAFAWKKHKEIYGPWKYITYKEVREAKPGAFVDPTIGKGKKILIVGCGFSGALAALLLRQQGFEVTVLEKRKKAEPASFAAGILIDMRCQLLFAKAGIRMEEFEKFGLFCPRVTLALMPQKGDKLEDSVVMFNGKESGSMEHSTLAVDRTLFIDYVSEKAAALGVKFHYGNGATSFDLKGGSVQTVDGTSYTADLIVASDGVNSLLRAAAVTQEPSRVSARVENPPLSYCVFNLTTHDPYMKDSIRFLGGDNWMVNITPAITSSNPPVYFATLCAPPKFIEAAMADPKSFISNYAKQLLTLDPNVASSLSQAVRFDFRTVSMDPYALTSGSVPIVFLGDSCHATTPFLGQGANVALRDAEFLCNAIKECGSLKEAASKYSERAYKVGHGVVRASEQEYQVWTEQRVLPHILRAFQAKMATLFPNIYVPTVQISDFQTDCDQGQMFEAAEFQRQRPWFFLGRM